MAMVKIHASFRVDGLEMLRVWWDWHCLVPKIQSPACVFGVTRSHSQIEGGVGFKFSVGTTTSYIDIDIRYTGNSIEDATNNMAWYAPSEDRTIVYDAKLSKDRNIEVRSHIHRSPALSE